MYEGVQSNLDRKVAIKILPETLSKDDGGLNFTERFKLEAKSMARMNHPGIISVYDFGQTSEGQLYYVMEFIDGMDIHQYLKHHGGKLPQDSAIAIIAHVLDALGYAHERGIVHRDIKPANIMIKSSGRVKVADFGLVKRLSASGEGSPDSAAITMSNVAIGTPDFVAPESLETGRIVDHRADLYSVGVMFYQLLTGSVPRGNFKPPSGRIKGLDQRLDPIVSRAMEAEPDDRYSSAEEFRAAIDEVLASPVPEDHFTGPIRPESNVPVTRDGKRLHMTSVKKKTPAPAGSTGPVKSRVPQESQASTGQPDGSTKKNPWFLAALIGVPVIALSIGGFLLMGGVDEKKRKSGGGQKSRPVEVADRGKGGGGNATKKPKPKPSASKQNQKQASKPERPTSEPPTPVQAPKPVAPVMADEPSEFQPLDLAKFPIPPKKEKSKGKSAAISAAATSSTATPPPAPAATTTSPTPLATPVPPTTSPTPPTVPVSDPDDPVSKRLAEIDGEYRKAVDDPYQTALATLKNQFTDALKREEQAVSQTGDLDQVLAFQNEAKRIGNGKGAGPADEADAPPGLKSLRQTWHDQVEVLETKRVAAQEIAHGARDEALDLYQQELVKAQEIKAALRVKAVREGFGVKASVQAEPEWISLFDGDSLDGWKTSGDESAFTVVGGAIRARKARGLLYYTGQDAQSGVFKNFELHAKVKTEDAFNSGIFFHSVIEDGEPGGGYEAQIANENRDPRKTGSLWEVSDVSEMVVSDGDWFEFGIRVEGKEITISIDGEVVTRWTEPEDWTPKKKGQRLSEGHFVLQSIPGVQNNRGEVWFKDIRVRRLGE